MFLFFCLYLFLFYCFSWYCAFVIIIILMHFVMVIKWDRNSTSSKYYDVWLVGVGCIAVGGCRFEEDIVDVTMMMMMMMMMVVMMMVVMIIGSLPMKERRVVCLLILQ